MDQEQIRDAFGKELRVSRTRLGISQESLALQIGLDRTYISMLERGVRQPSLTTIFMLAPALNTTATELVSRVQNRLAGM